MMARRTQYVVAAILALALSACGCWGPQSPPPAPPAASGGPAAAIQPAVAKPAADRTASEILQQLLATYRQAKTYQDQGVVRLAYRRNGQPEAEESPVAVAFERPGKLSLVAYQATVKCDGRELRARIEDEASRNIDGQVIVRPSPAAIAIQDLAADELLYNTICSKLRRQPIQLELLLESGGLVSAFESDIACRRLDDDSHEGRMCFRVEVPSPGGEFVFWVDQEAGLLRRLDYPAAALVPELIGDPAVSDVQLLADLRGASLGGAIAADQFVMGIPAGAKRMKSFVLPPPPLASGLLGKSPGAFSFTNLDGAAVASTELADKIAVLVWYHDDPACTATLQQISLARQRLKDDAAVRFLAIATDPTETNNEMVRQRLREWQVDLPIVRDLAAFGRSAFQIDGHPTIVVLDAKCRVQLFQTGGNPQLAEQLVNIAERLKRGDDLAGELLERRAGEQKQYEELVAKGGPEPGQLVELPEAVIRRRNEPRQLKLQPLWTCTELKSPGNLLLVEEEGRTPRIFVFEGWRTIAEVDGSGKIVGRHTLELPEQAAVAFARTAVNKEGQRYFAVSAPLAPQVFVFDENWKLQLTYPPTGAAPLGVLDLALADVEAPDGQPEIVAASVGGQGLVAVSLDGKVRWQNRALPNVVSVAASRPDETGSWAFFVTGEGERGESGSLLRISRFGQHEPPIQVGQRSILTLTAARFPAATQAAFLGVAGGPRGERLAVGLTTAFKEAWNYPLPAGVHARPIEAITSSHVLKGRKGEWWLAGPDGSIHVVSEDGEFFDSFHYGAALSGLAAMKLGEKPVLLVASDDGLAAWEIQAPAPTPAARER